jgi:nitrogen fixation protein NifB
MNCIPVVPTKETGFESIEEPSKVLMFNLRAKVAEQINIMSHCSRCRADAAGLLGQDFQNAMGILQEYAMRVLDTKNERPYIAVATHEGMLVNCHLGEAATLFIYEQTPNGFHFVCERNTPSPGSGDARWAQLGTLLQDCRALLVSGVGGKPTRILQSTGIRVIQMTGLIDEGLEAIYNGKTIRTVKKVDAFRCGESCKGTASGCA